MLDRETFAGALVACANLYGRSLSADAIDLFCRTMARYETDEVLRALELHVLDPDVGQYLPKPADLVRRITGGNGNRAALAWAKVAHAIRTVGIYQSVVFDDPLIHACLAEMGGWIKACELKEDEMPFRARDFERLYLGYRQRGETPHYPPKLIGKAEAYNGEKGYEVAPPLLLGDAKVARMVYEGGSDKPRLARELLPALMAP
jgi:hypothetical protein